MFDDWIFLCSSTWREGNEWAYFMAVQVPEQSLSLEVPLKFEQCLTYLSWVAFVNETFFHLARES
jgi:hypothetical protein